MNVMCAVVVFLGTILASDTFEKLKNGKRLIDIKGREVRADQKSASPMDSKMVVHVARRENCPPVWD